MTFLQHEPSAHAPCTKTIVEFGGNPLVLEVCGFAAARAVFCARANRVREPSRATPKDAAVSAPRNLRRSMFSSSHLLSGNEQKYSSLSRSFCFQPADAIRGEEVFHRGRDFYHVCLNRKVPGIEELHLRAWQVLSKRFCSRRDEEGIVLAPDRKQTRLRFAKIFLEFRIKLHVRRIIQE